MKHRLAAPLVLSLLLMMATPEASRGAADDSAAYRTAHHLFVALGTIEDYRVAGARYDLLIVSPERPLDAALLRARAAYPSATIIGYLNTMDMNESMPHAREALSGHEDWFLHDASGQRVRVRADRYTGSRSRYGMNVGVPGYQDFLADRAIEILKAGYDGLQLDNVETDSSYHPSRVGGYISGLPVELTRDAWPEAERSMLARIRGRVSQAGLAGKLLIINQIRPAEPEVSRLYLREVDGANCEGWLSRRIPHDGRFGWKAKVEQAAEVSRAGKILNLINREAPPSEEESLYLFASYLLALEGDRLHFYHGAGYRPEATRWFDFYDIDIGRAEGPMILRRGAYVRTFSRGFVAVNPFDRAAVVEAPPGMSDLQSRPAGRLDLAPRTAAILRRVTAPETGSTQRPGAAEGTLPR